MCLLKVYLDNGGDSSLIAEDIALIVKEGDGFKLLGLDLTSETVLEEVEVSRIDTLNAVMIVKPKR
jgi:predicted RNA-binding protein